jgi:hypothetical protein
MSTISKSRGVRHYFLKPILLITALTLIPGAADLSAGIVMHKVLRDGTKAVVEDQDLYLIGSAGKKTRAKDGIYECTDGSRIEVHERRAITVQSYVLRDGTKLVLRGDQLYVLDATGKRTRAKDGKYEYPNGNFEVAGGKVIATEYLVLRDGTKAVLEGDKLYLVDTAENRRRAADGKYESADGRHFDVSATMGIIIH